MQTRERGPPSARVEILLTLMVSEERKLFQSIYHKLCKNNLVSTSAELDFNSLDFQYQNLLIVNQLIEEKK